MDAYSAASWTADFTAIAGSSAALTGLLFVAISINLSQIIKVPGLADRAAEVLIQLTAVLAMATLLLMPNQSSRAIGAEVLGIAVLAEVFVTAIQVRSYPKITAITTRARFGIRVVAGQWGLILLLVGGVSLLAQAAGGLYWVVPAMVVTMIGAIVGAWVLLVEIVR